ncbi:DEAD/DEAH box helicase [Desulfosarcina cetonica]|uniref:DEAD/DEAH box helicase n=1 Tax=Desulfosarcina cetonica TaxID=90730 RepID=UPI000A8E6C28|nr:DEAD/DEAH box helicase [Desulfosarcina cetonica]
MAVAPGARIEVRDAEWLVKRVDRTSTGGQALSVIGISELVRDKDAIFLTEIENKIDILDPRDTKLVTDDSSAYQASLLYMESLLRRKPPTDQNLYIGHKAAMDPVPYQLDPAIQALQQPRQRILIADAVGLGKTLAAGILLSELIRRGKGKRILVLAVKSMLTQFQKEMWSRFTIPLVRLDSVGIQRIRSRIPTNQNPFFYYDRSIISIDTLKQDTEYRTYLENAYWDIIVIDEAHNVAERGNASSQRAKLANLLSERSDTLIMLSATPHDGKARSFASLMNMLDPTAIANPEKYGPEDIKGLYIRRFKKDIQHQVEMAFKEREIRVAHCDASPLEESAFDGFIKIQFSELDQKRGPGQLFKITLEKALFSSPAACLKTIANRINRLEKDETSRFAKDIQTLRTFADAIAAIDSDDFSKYQKLLDVITDQKNGFGWTPNDSHDRIVIFTERIETLNFLKKNLIRDLNLKEKQVAILYGGMSDIEQQQVVEDFGKDESPIRLMVASDVASEGINLHYLSHRMIHFDIPWSLMVFQQRNGRIDRYGQTETPQIVYLVTRSEVERIRGDMRILELLIQKDNETVKNIGDPAEFMGVYDIDEEEKKTADAIEQGLTPEEFQAFAANHEESPESILFGDDEPPTGQMTEIAKQDMPSLFKDDFDYVASAIGYLRHFGRVQADLYPDEKRIDIAPNDELKSRFRFHPREIWPDDGFFVLSADKSTIQEEIKRSRKDEKAWPQIHYLWELNPVVDWINDKLQAAFRRHEAPVLEMPSVLQDGETIFLMSGLIPNRKSHPLVHRWFGVCFQNGQPAMVKPFEMILDKTGLGTTSFPNEKRVIDVDRIKP